MPHESVGFQSDQETFSLMAGIDDSPITFSAIEQPPPSVTNKSLEVSNRPPFSANCNLEFNDAHTDCWTRFKLISNNVNVRAAIVLGFTEWVTHRHDYPEWASQAPWGISVVVPNQNYSSAWIVGNHNASLHANVDHVDGSYSFPTDSDPLTIDLRARYDGVITFPYDRWHAECWINDEMISWADLDLENSQNHPPIFASIKGIAIPNHYGDPGITKIDDISAGTSRGSDNILSVIDFEDGTFGPFELFDNALYEENPFTIVEDVI